MAGVDTSADTSEMMGLHTEPLKGRDIKTMFSLENEGGYAYAFAPDVDFNKRGSVDCEGKEATEINREIRDLIKSGHGTVVLENPGAKHSIIVGILHRMNFIVNGSLGYFGCGLLDGPTVRISGRVGWSFAENMMAGVCVVEKIQARPSVRPFVAEILFARALSGRVPALTRKAEPFWLAVTRVRFPAS